MFDDHRILGSHHAGTSACVVNVSSPMHYSRRFVSDEPGVYILICDSGKNFSLISNKDQIPDKLPIGNSYIKTNFKSGYFNAPASYVSPLDSENKGYILQSVMKTGNSTAYICPCDLGAIKTDDDSIPYLTVTPQMVWYGLFGQRGAYYPGNRNIIGDFQAPNLNTVGIPLLNTDVYVKSNGFKSDVITGKIPVLSAAVNANTIRFDPGSPDTYKNITFPTDIIPGNICTATNTNIYPQGYNYWSAPMEGRTADGLSYLSYTLCYPISLTGNSSKLIEDVIADPQNFLVVNGEYARPLCRGFHIYATYTKYSFTFQMSSFIPGPFIGVLLTWKPASSTFAWTNYPVGTDKNSIYSCGMYANTDVIFTDVMYISISTLTAGLRYQVLRSRRGSLIVRYKPDKTFIYHDLSTSSLHPPFTENDDLFYLTNGLNPEEYMHCDGVLFGKQQFKYSTFNKNNPILDGGAWAPGDQGVLLRGVKIVLDKGLLMQSFRAVPNKERDDTLEWEFIDFNISSLSHGIGYINQIVQQFSDGGTGLTDSMLESRNYTSSCQAPYDTVFCDGAEYGEPYKIPNCLLLGMTSNQGFLDDIYDKILSQVQLRIKEFNINKIQNKPDEDAFDIIIYSIVLVSTDQEMLYTAAVSYETASTRPGISGIYTAPLNGMNQAARSISGAAFLNGGNGYKHLLFKQFVHVEYSYVFDINIEEEQRVDCTFTDFPFGSCTCCFSTAAVTIDTEHLLVPLQMVKMSIAGGVPIPMGELAFIESGGGLLQHYFEIVNEEKVFYDSLNDADGLTFPKIYVYNDYIFTHSGRYIIMLDTDGVELYRTQMLCVKNQNAQHTYIDRFDLLISEGFGEYIISEYFKSLEPKE
jgi:hypothetical protein